jgi:hypothetical protein
MTKDWWGFDTQLKTWVYLDRSVTNNQPEFGHLPLIFVDCKSERPFEVIRDYWKEPRFIFEGRVQELRPEESQSVIDGLKTKVHQYKGLVQRYVSKLVSESKSSLVDSSLNNEAHHFQREKLSPEAIRAMYAKEYSDDAWSEVISYVAQMNQLEIRDHGKCNEYITRNGLWHRYPNIRAMNDHGYGHELEGITRTAYRLVCKIINLQNSHGAPLLHSRKY